MSRSMQKVQSWEESLQQQSPALQRDLGTVEKPPVAQPRGMQCPVGGKE